MEKLMRTVHFDDEGERSWRVKGKKVEFNGVPFLEIPLERNVWGIVLPPCPDCGAKLPSVDENDWVDCSCGSQFTVML